MENPEPFFNFGSDGDSGGKSGTGSRVGPGAVTNTGEQMLGAGGSRGMDRGRMIALSRLKKVMNRLTPVSDSLTESATFGEKVRKIQGEKMRNIIRVELLIAILLLSFGSGMTSAVAGENPVMSPKMKAPAVKTLPAVAKQYHYQAVARTQVLKSGQVRAGALSWQCQGSVCKISGPWPTPAVSACKALASQIGAIRSYGYSGHMLSAAQLEQCNAGIAEQARKPVAKGARQSMPAPVLAAPVAPAGSKKSQPKGFTPPSTPRIEQPKIEQPKITAPQGGVAKSLTGPGGKSRLPPQTDGRRVLIDDDTSPPPRLGGFVSGFVPPQQRDEIVHAPVTGPGGESPLPSAPQLGGFVPPQARDEVVHAPPTGSGGDPLTLPDVSRTGTLQTGDKIQLIGFGEFSSSERSARTGRNPATGKPGGVEPSQPGAGPSVRQGGFAPATDGHREDKAMFGSITGPAQKLAKINENSREFRNFKRQFTEAMAAAERRVKTQRKEAYLSGADCDDGDAEVSPGRTEICDHKDNNCDGVIDEDVGISKFSDIDGDTHGDPTTMMKVCPSDVEKALGSGHWLVDVGNDCDDQDPDHWHDCPTAR